MKLNYLIHLFVTVVSLVRNENIFAQEDSTATTLTEGKINTQVGGVVKISQNGLDRVLVMNSNDFITTAGCVKLSTTVNFPNLKGENMSYLVITTFAMRDGIPDGGSSTMNNFAQEGAVFTGDSTSTHAANQGAFFVPYDTAGRLMIELIGQPIKDPTPLILNGTYETYSPAHSLKTVKISNLPLIPTAYLKGFMQQKKFDFPGSSLSLMINLSLTTEAVLRINSSGVPEEGCRSYPRFATPIADLRPTFYYQAMKPANPTLEISQANPSQILFRNGSWFEGKYQIQTGLNLQSWTTLSSGIVEYSGFDVIINNLPTTTPSRFYKLFPKP